MTRSDSSTWPSGFPRALHQTLLRRLPPKASSIHLEDLVNALMDALARGELQLNLTAMSPPQELKAMGWPEAHCQVLPASH